MNLKFAYVQFFLLNKHSLGECRKLYPFELSSEWSSVEIHKMYTPPTSTSCFSSWCCYEPHLSTSGVTTFCQISGSLAPLSQSFQAAVLLKPTLTSKPQVFFEVEYHTYSSNFVFLNHLTCVKLCQHFLLGSYPFLCGIDKVFECCNPDPIFLILLYIILNSAVIFRKHILL